MVSCVSYPKKNNFVKSEINTTQVYNPYFSNVTKDYVYKANLEFYKKKFSGIVIIKKISDQEHRLVFTTEMGNKIFDFSFYKNTFKVNHILEDMNKKIILNTLQRDFTSLLKEYNYSRANFLKQNVKIQETKVLDKTHFYFYDSTTLTKIVRVDNGKEKVVYYFSNSKNSIAQQILIEHKNIKLKIHLKGI